jgi:(2Fe-2S) ferredoxin
MTDLNTPNPVTSDTTHLAEGSSEMPTIPTVYVCQYRSCHDRGSEQTLAAFIDQLPDGTIAVASRCMGQCSSGPTVRIATDETWYCRVQADNVETIVNQHIIGGETVTEKLNPRLHRTFYG